MQKLGVFWKIQDICYNIGTEIFKIFGWFQCVFSSSNKKTNN